MLFIPSIHPKSDSKEGSGKSGIKLDPDGTDEGTPLVNQKTG